ncbi:MAG: dienelactone hydrolase family protein [Chloroflexi bacterium]|nr:dienelactone hydrolase family protein [Chloroflexota bacterium]
MYEGMIAETIALYGHRGDQLEAYAARPIGAASVPGMVVLHHMPGWDEWTQEVVRKLAHRGYAAIAPHLFSRLGPGAWDDLAAAARSAGGMPDEQVMGDLSAAAKLMKMQPNANGKVGVIGFCSGGRQAYLAACTVDGLDAAVDCWGGRVIVGPEGLNERNPHAPIEFTSRMHMPLLGIFGNDDANPDVEQVNRTEAELQKYGKEYEFHRYDGAGHGFFATDRPGYRQEQAVDGWKKVFAFLDRHLKVATREPASAVVS